MNKISDGEYKILKEIYSHPKSLNKDEVSEDENKIYKSLDARGYAKIHSDITGFDENGFSICLNTYSLSITLDGKTYVDSKKSDDRHWRIPVIISVIALILSASAIYLTLLQILSTAP